MTKRKEFGSKHIKKAAHRAAERKVKIVEQIQKQTNFSQGFYSHVKEIFETCDVNELIEKLQSGEGWIAVAALKQFDQIRFIMFRI